MHDENEDEIMFTFGIMMSRLDIQPWDSWWYTLLEYWREHRG